MNSLFYKANSISFVKKYISLKLQEKNIIKLDFCLKIFFTKKKKKEKKANQI